MREGNESLVTISVLLREISRKKETINRARVKKNGPPIGRGLVKTSRYVTYFRFARGVADEWVGGLNPAFF